MRFLSLLLLVLCGAGGSTHFSQNTDSSTMCILCCWSHTLWWVDPAKTEINFTNDIQGGLELKPMRHQQQKHPNTQNEALRIATGCDKMSSVEHLHIEAKVYMVRKHLEVLLLSSTYSHDPGQMGGS